MAKKKAIATVPETNLTLLAKELQLNRIAADMPGLFKSESLLKELHHAVAPHLHEGKLSHFGAMFLDALPQVAGVRVIPLKQPQHQLARSLADGIRSFVLFIKNEFVGQLVFEEQGADEYVLVQFLEKKQGRHNYI